MGVTFRTSLEHGLYLERFRQHKKTCIIWFYEFSDLVFLCVDKIQDCRLTKYTGLLNQVYVKVYKTLGLTSREMLVTCCQDILCELTNGVTRR
jgi:hypothetical protein